MFSCEFCKIFKNTFSYRTPPVAASVTLPYCVVKKPLNNLSVLIILRPVFGKGPVFLGETNSGLQLFKNFNKYFSRECHMLCRKSIRSAIFSVVCLFLLVWPNILSLITCMKIRIYSFQIFPKTTNLNNFHQIVIYIQMLIQNPVKHLGWSVFKRYRNETLARNRSNPCKLGVLLYHKRHM